MLRLRDNRSIKQIGKKRQKQTIGICYGSKRTAAYITLTAAVLQETQQIPIFLFALSNPAYTVPKIHDISQVTIQLSCSSSSPRHIFKNPQINCCSFLKNHDILALSSSKPCFFFKTLLPFILVLILCLLQEIYSTKLFHIISHSYSTFFKLFVVFFFKVTHELRGIYQAIVFVKIINHLFSSTFTSSNFMVFQSLVCLCTNFLLVFFHFRLHNSIAEHNIII